MKIKSDTNNFPFISVVIPMFNEEKYIANCLNSIIEQDISPDNYEILVIDGLSTDNSPGIVKSLSQKHPNIKYLLNPNRKTTFGLNIGINEAIGEIIVRMDSHGIAPKNYLSTCARYLVERVAENIGGVVDTSGEGYWGQTIALATSCPFGVGNSKFRYSKEKKGFDQAGWPGAFWKSKILELNGFDETLGCNEDDDFNYRLMKDGNKVFWTSEIIVKYFGRSSLKKLWQQYFKYGYWKVKIIQRYGKLTSIRHIIPTLFVLSIILFAILGIFNNHFYLTFLLILGLYLSGALYFSFKISQEKGFKYLLSLPLTFIILHSSYGVGFLLGLLRYGVIKNK